MDKRAVKYKGLWLMPNSDAYRLYHEKKMKELDKHLKDVNERADKLAGIK